MKSTLLATIAASFAIVFGSSARVTAQEQDPKPKKAPPTREQKLAAACEAMTRLPSLAFDTKQKTTNRATGVVIRGLAKPKERTWLTSGRGVRGRDGPGEGETGFFWGATSQAVDYLLQFWVPGQPPDNVDLATAVIAYSFGGESISQRRKHK